MRKLLIQLGAFIVAGFVLWGVFAWRDTRLEKKLRSEMAISKRDTAITELTERQQKRDTVYIGTVRTYTTVRDKVLAANPENKPAKEIADAADDVVAQGDSLRAINDTLTDSLRKQVKEVKKLKALVPSRISGYALAGYDWYNAKPLAQVGGDMRIVGPFSVTAYLEAAKAEKNAPEPVVTRGVIAAKFTFR